MMNDYNSLRPGVFTKLMSSFQKKAALLLFFVMFSVLSVQGQVTVAGAVTGNGSYTTLGAAFTAIGTAQPSANITVTISGNTTEAVGGASLGAGTWTSLTIAPSGGSWTVSGAATAGTPLITFNGADNVTVNGGGNLTFSNTTVSTTSGTSTLKLVADATNNTFNNLIILGSANGATGSNTANVWISTGTTTGNDGNSFQSCKFGPAGSNLPGQLIVANGSTTSTALENSGITINNCEFYDYFQAASASAAIYMSTGNTAWTVTNNKIYQTAARTITTAQTDYGIFMVNAGATALGESYTVTGNTIGYASNAGTGTMTYSSGTTAGGFVGINLSYTATTTTTNTVSNNIVSDIQWTSTAGSAFTGINTSSVASTTATSTHTVTGNTVRNISLVTTTGAVVGISAGYAPTTSINTNTVNNITRTGSSTFYGIQYAGGATTAVTLNGNTISNLNFNNTTSTSALNAIYSVSSPATETITNNTINNIASTSTGTQTVCGIYNNTATGTKTITGNTLSNFSLASTSTGTIYGIRKAFGGTTDVVSGNTVNSFTGGTNIYAINIASGTTNNVYNNKVYGLSSSVATPAVYGIYVTSGTTNNVYNNIIGGFTTSAANTAIAQAGIYFSGGTTDNAYYNTVYLSGTSSGALFGTTAMYASTTPTVDMRDNILVNACTSNGATGFSTAYRRTSTTLTTYASTSNNNLLYGSTLYYDGTTAYASMAAYQALVTPRDTASKNQNPAFTSTTGSDSTFLHFTAGAINLAGGFGTVISGYTTDFDGNTRDTSTPDIGADEWVNGTISAPTITGFTTAYSPSAPIYLCANGGSVVTITGTALDTVTSVLFNGGTGVNLAGVITAQSATSLTVTAPANVVDGIIRVTNPGGSGDSSSSFTTATPPTVGVSSGSTICAGTATTLTATGGNTYTWSPSTALSATTGATVTASPTATTTYTVTGISTAGCTATSTVTLTATSAPPAITASSSSIAPCLGTTVNLSTTSGSIPNNMSEGFETFPPTGWTFVNAGTGNAWTSTTTYFRTGTKALYYSYNSTNAADAWAFTPAQSLIAGVTYTVSYWYRGNSTSFPENLKLTVGSDVTKASQTTTLATQANITTTTYTQVSVTYTPTVSGTYYFALNCYSAANMNYLAVDDFSISGSQPATYSWTSSPEGFTSSVQNPTGVSTTAATIYTVVATANGCSKTSSVTVTPNALPTISTNGTSICNGGSGATLTATGGATYAWTPTTGLSSGSGASVTANPSSTTTYTVTGTDANSCVNTATAVVTVNNPVAITGQPSNQLVLDAATASFTVAATGTGLTFQWEESADSGSTWTPVSGATSATYSFTAAASQSGYKYHCIVSGTSPCAPATSAAATLTISNVSFLTQPANQTICSSSTATFSVTTDGTVTSSQWQYSTDGTNWFDVLGQTSTTYELTGLTSANTGQLFRIQLNGSVNSNPATLTVYDAVAITAQPASTAVCSGSNATFTATATGYGLTYQWQMSTNGTSWSNVSGATTASYTVTAPTGTLNGRQYRLVVSGTSPCAPLTSDAVTLTVTDVTAAASSASICLGASTTLNATFVGAPDYTSATWTSTTGSGAETAVSGASASVTPTAVGSYTYTFASNGTCPFTKTVSVTVNALPIISSVSATPATVCSGANISLAAASVANANGTVALGAGASTSTSTAASVFPGFWGGAKSQYLIKASELTALGLAAGNITSIAFEPTTSGQTYQGFFVSVASTSATTLSTTFLANGTQVYAGTLTDNGFTPVANTVNTLAFGTGSGSASSFTWDGTSNIVVTFSWSRVPSAATSTASSMKYDTASFVCTTYKQADSQTPAAMLAQTTGTTSSSRPKFTFGGVVATNFASTYTWSWNSTPAVTAASGTTTVTNTSGSDVSNTYTATATNAAGCTLSATTSAVTVHSVVPAPTATDSSQCGSQTPSCSVTGTGNAGNTFRWYTVATAGTAIAGQTASALVSYPVGATTTFYVSEATADGLCESARTPVTVTVTTPYAFTLSSSAVTNCSGVPSTTAVTIGTNGGYTSYSWTNSSSVTGNDTTGWYFSPTTTTTYTVTATDGVCSNTASVTVTPIALPIVTATASPTAVCIGASSTITALTTTIAAGTVKVGTSTTTNTSSIGYPTAFGDYWYQDWQQYVFTAAELNALGLTAGNITSLKFDIAALPSSGSISDYNVKIGSTSSSTLSGFTTTGLTNVYGPASFTPAVGSNTITFSTPYSWNGTSNIIVDIRETGLYGSANATTNYTTTTGNTVVYAYASTSNSSFWTSAPTATTSTSRPNITFAGQKVTPGVGSLAYSWNDAASTTGNVLTVTPSATTTYTVYGLNGTNGCIGTANATVTLFNPPTAPTATNGSRCGTGLPTTATVVDSNGFTTPTFKWYADNTTTTALQSSTSTSFTTPVSATTTYYVSVVSPGGCESDRTPVTITVNTPATLSVSPDATVCTAASTTLTASGAVSYTWTPALGLNGTTTASVVATPSASTTYSVTGVDANGCTTAAATVRVTVAPYPSTVSITPGAGSLCANTVMSLTATGGTIGGSGTATLGTGTTTTSTAGNTPFDSNWEGSRTQYLVKASELTALGMTAGNLTSLSFNLTAANAYVMNNYAVKIAHTTDTAISTAYGTPTGSFTTVYSNAALPIQPIGTSTLTFNTPFAWNGTSNILIDICHDNDTSASCTSCYGTSATVAYTATSFNSVFGSYADDVQSCGTTAASTLTTNTNRPNMVFGYSSLNNSPVTWSPTTDLYTNAAATIPYTGGAASVVYTKPSAEITYTATATNGSCTTSATTTVSPNPVPSFSVNGVTICNGQSTTLAASAPGYSYSWSPATGLSATTGSSVTANPTATTTYTVVATDTVTGCTTSQTVTVTVTQPGAVLTAGTTTAQTVVPGQDTTFTVATQSGVTYTYQWQVNAGSGWSDISDDSNYSGTATATLSVTNIDSSFDQYQYQCIVTGPSPCASLTPIAALLTVSSTGFSQQPQSVTLCGPGSTTYSIATSGDEPFGIQWQMSTDGGTTYNDLAEGLDATTGMTFSGVDQLTLNVSGITAANNSVKFICMVNFFLPSSPASITVKTPVAIATQPVDQTVCASGGTATFSTSATGDDLAYQWQYSTNGGSTWTDYTGTGATSASISIVNPAVSANGTLYHVVVSGNAVCSSVTSSAATLFINNPTVTSQPTAATVIRGNTASYTVVASVATSYQWQYSTTLNGTYSNVVDSTPTGISYVNATEPTLSVVTSSAAATGGAKYYRCVVTNNGCVTTSTGALLTITDYCTTSVTNTADEEIYNVTVNGNSTDATYSYANGCSTVAPGPGSVLSKYSNFTTLGSLTTVQQLQNVSFSIAEDECDGASYFSNGAAIWVDFNQDGDFDDAGEKVFVENATTISPRTIANSFVVPLTATLGETRMRVIVAEGYSGATLVPCGSYGYGEVEDYLITIAPAPTCSGTPVAGTAAAGSTTLCTAGTGTTLTLAGYTTGVTNVTLQWYMSTNGTTFAPVSGATTDTLTTGSLTATTSYYCAVTCTNSNETVNSNTVTISVNDPSITASTPAGRCGTGTLTLGATANDGSTINWYSAATGGAVLGTGTSFTTPSISATTTYYAEANTVGGLRTASGLGNTTIPTSTGASAERGIVFTATSNGTIVSAQYYSPTLNVTNTVTVRLVDNATGTQVGSSLSLSIAQGATAGFYTMNLNLPVTAGTTYRLLASFSQSVNRISTGANYATAAYSNLGSLGTITSGYDSGVTSASYNYFHNIAAIIPGCTSARTAVVATVTPTPTATISYATPICSTAGTASVTLNGTNAYTGGTFSSTAGLSIDSVTGAIDVASSTPGTYTVTYTTNPIANCGAQTATTSVTINQALTSGFTYDAATYCTNQGTATPSMTGSAGTFTASPAGLTINSATGAITLASSAAGTYTVTNTVVVAGCSTSTTTATVTVNTAVAITSQPAGVSKLPTEDATFSVAATGTGLTYQWQVNDGTGYVDISGATSNTLTVTGVTIPMNGYLYQVIVSGAAACNSVTSSAALLTVSTAAIATHPANYTACNEGANTASFTITTTGDATSYQWQVSTNGTSWSDISNGGIYANADTASLSLSGITLSNDGWKFRCVVNGVVYSNAGTLSVKTAVAITTPPANYSACTAGAASFSVVATGSNLAYQWQVSTNGTTWSNVSGATSATLLLTGLTAGMNGNQYQVIVSGASPCSPVTSSAATLTVNTAVAITTQPASSTVCNAANATYTVAATGTGVGYQWQMSTNGTTWSDVSGETSATITVASVTNAMTGYQYRVVVSGAAPCGSVTSSAATLTVSQPVAPTATASTADFCAGSVVTLTAGNVTNDAYANSFDALPSNFATSVVGTGTPTATLNTLKAEGTGSVLFNTTSTSANVAYSMNANLNLSTASTATVTFSHIAAMESPSTSYDYGYVEYSANGGTTWTTFPSTAYTGTAASAVFTGGNARFTTKSYPAWISALTSSTVVPTDALWKNESFTVPAAALTSQFRIRFRYTTDSSTNYYGWLIDNVKVTVPNGTVSWSPTTGLYTNAGATTAYTGGNAAVVYAKPSASATYTVTTTNSLGCTNTGTVSINQLAPATLASITQPLITCSGAQTTFALTGLLPNSTSTLGYTINGVAQTAIAGVVADASGNATFTVALSGVNNGKTLAITSILRTDLTPSCTTAITANNTVTVAVQPLVTYYADADGDGFGNNAVTTITCQGQPTGYVTNNTDCDDTDATKHASFTFYVDADGDGYGAGTGVSLCAVNASTPPQAGYVVDNTDCDDTDALKHLSYLFYADIDGDGYGAGTAVSVCAVNPSTPPTGYSLNGTDCNATDATMHASFSFYVDADGDGYGAGTAVSLCAVNATTPPAGYAVNGTDCNDANALIHASFSFYADADGDGYGAGTAVSFCAVDANTPPSGYVTNNTDCNDANASMHASYSFYVDADGDGYGAGTAVTVCAVDASTPPAGYSLSNTDCNDGNASLNPTNPCDSVVHVKMNIQGYYDADTHAMRPVLMNQGVGSSSTDVDNVTIELHDATTFEVVATATAMLHTDGTATATYSSAPSGSFFIVIKHRNSVQTWSSTPQAVGPITALTYDFTTAATKAYGDNMVEVESGVYAMYTGDIDQDGNVNNVDYSLWETDANNLEFGYFATDLDGDGNVNNVDYSIWESSANALIYSIVPNP